VCRPVLHQSKKKKAANYRCYPTADASAKSKDKPRSKKGEGRGSKGGRETSVREVQNRKNVLEGGRRPRSTEAEKKKLKKGRSTPGEVKPGGKKNFRRPGRSDRNPTRMGGRMAYPTLAIAKRNLGRERILRTEDRA